jgi:hypothetical protein
MMLMLLVRTCRTQKRGLNEVQVSRKKDILAWNVSH